MYNEVINLISYDEVTTPGGIVKRIETPHEVLCNVLSITQSEVYQAAASGLKPEYKFELADYLDYNNEKEVEFNGVRYSIKRTYRNGRQLEITAYGMDE